jgi:hypothetical protein
MQKRFAFPPHQSLRDSFPSREGLFRQKEKHGNSIKITVLIGRRWRDSPAFFRRGRGRFGRAAARAKKSRYRPVFALVDAHAKGHVRT